LQLVDQNSALKKEAGIAERKLLARNERIQNLEALLQDADRRLALQNQKFEAQLQAVKDRLDQARGTYIHGTSSASICNLEYFPAQKAAPSPLSFAGRIAKPLRGGGGGIVPNAAIQTPTATAVPTNPLSRVQNEER
jgi:kinesin family member 5